MLFLNPCRNHIPKSTRWAPAPSGLPWPRKRNGASSSAVPAPSAAFKDAVNVYRDACTAAGTTPSVGFIKAIYLHEDEATAHAEAREARAKLCPLQCRATVDDHADK